MDEHVSLFAHIVFYSENVKGKIVKNFLKSKCTLVAVAQWIECQLQTKKALVRFPVRAHAWVAGRREATDQCISCTLMFLSFSFSLPFPLSKNK